MVTHIIGSVAAGLSHRDSHQQLLRFPAPGSLPAVDAVVVPASRATHHLATAADLATKLGCLFVALCSRKAEPEDFAGLAERWPALRWVAVGLPTGYQHPLLAFATTGIVDVKVNRLGDLSLKRNLALLIARIAGWRSMLLLDDDIYDVDEMSVRQGAAALDRLNMVGLAVQGQPDNSVVCHANREAGRPQKVFVGGSALLVNCERQHSFFPDVYNEDWFFLHDSVAQSVVGSSGTAKQLPYDPFADLSRAVAEEFGDTLAEGLFSLLHDPRLHGMGTETGFWRYFLDRRRDFIESAMRGLGDIKPGSKALLALREAERRRAAISPESCAAYIKTWRVDQSAWRSRLDGIDRLGSVAAAIKRLGLHESFFHSPLSVLRKHSSERVSS